MAAVARALGGALMITLRNRAHQSQARVTVSEARGVLVLSEAEYRRAQVALCGREGCDCAPCVAVNAEEPVWVIGPEDEFVDWIATGEVKP